jgi:DNA end-binding protein Ku
VNQKAADFEPEKFEDHYEQALTELINAKRNGNRRQAAPRRRERGGRYGRAEEKHRNRDFSEGQETPQGLRRPKGDTAADRRQGACREESGQARAGYRAQKGWITLAVPNRCQGEIA